MIDLRGDLRGEESHRPAVHYVTDQWFIEADSLGYVCLNRLTSLAHTDDTQADPLTNLQRALLRFIALSAEDFASAVRQATVAETSPLPSTGGDTGSPP